MDYFLLNPPGFGSEAVTFSYKFGFFKGPFTQKNAACNHMVNCGTFETPRLDRKQFKFYQRHHTLYFSQQLWNGLKQDLSYGSKPRFRIRLKFICHFSLLLLSLTLLTFAPIGSSRTKTNFKECFVYPPWAVTKKGHDN